MTEAAYQTDQELLNLLSTGHEPALEAIHHRYWKLLFHSAYKVLQNEAAAQDAVQEVFISLWERRQIAHVESLKAYLTKAVRFQVLNTIRSAKIDQHLTDKLKVASFNIIYQQPHLFAELQDLYRQVLSSLPTDQQEIFRLNREEGLSYQQIAELKGISIKTVEKKMSQALKSLRLGLDEGLILIAASSLLS